MSIISRLHPMLSAIVGVMPAQAWVTLIVGALATVGVLITWQQKNRADRRSEWWRRTQWAFERTFSDDDSQAVLGWRMLAALAGSKLATGDDSTFVQVIAEHAALGDDEQGESGDGNESISESGQGAVT
ncbi:hypothetical protein [Mycobacterium sp. M23085]|uniref:hypothetical protein n=1 Tax=Mycobacterium sp. M23085 TaxID=3378087 RepID=UPI003878425A